MRTKSAGWQWGVALAAGGLATVALVCLEAAGGDLASMLRGAKAAADRSATQPARETDAPPTPPAGRAAPGPTRPPVFPVPMTRPTFGPLSRPGFGPMTRPVPGQPLRPPLRPLPPRPPVQPVQPLPPETPDTPPQTPEPPPVTTDPALLRTVETAQTTRIRPRAEPSFQTGYLGLHVRTDEAGQLIVAELAQDSPALKAGVKAGDVLVSFDGRPVADRRAFREAVQAAEPGRDARLIVRRAGRAMELGVEVGATSRPMNAGAIRAVIGAQMIEWTSPPGLMVEEVQPGMPAARIGMRKGDLILQVDRMPVSTLSGLGKAVGQKRPGEVVTLAVRRQGKVHTVSLPLASPAWEPRLAMPSTQPWRAQRYRLAVVPIDFPDAAHNEQIGLKDWQQALFSEGSYTKLDATGQPVCGSLRDYYLEQSGRALSVEGRVFAHVEAQKNRMDYSPGSGTVDRGVLLGEVLDKLLTREGAAALEGFDGLLFIYSGSPVVTSRGGIYWPHRSSFVHKGKRWGYVMVCEGGKRMCGLTVICHEFGHMLGLPDLYATPENPGSEGAGTWCLMSSTYNQFRPQHMNAWCKEYLGWLTPAVIDPSVPQRLVLSPVEGSGRECFKVLIRRDGSEYLLLENRRKVGYDLDLPGQGMLIWRVVNNKCSLEESHGVEGPAGPSVFGRRVPYPSPANDAYTPYTRPSSRSLLGGGLEVHITNIRQMPDGRVSFWIGYEFD